MKLFLILLLLSEASAQLRIISEGFKVPESEIRAILESTLDLFSHDDLPPLLVTRGHEGPITLFQRTDRGEVVIQLDTGGRYWAQYIYQFAHELTHVAARFQPGHHANKWLEESLCETASLYALRTMSITWRDHAPAPHLKAYRGSLHKYAQTILATREKPTRGELPAYYQIHRETLRRSSVQRPINGAIAGTLLPFFESNPRRWKILASLHSFPCPKDASLATYLDSWSKAAPEQPFIPTLKKLLLP